MKHKLQFLIATIFVLTISTWAVQAQANLVFSGGNGTPLSITLQQSVSYTINSSNRNCTNRGPVFVFDETGNPLQQNSAVANGGGTITYSNNNAASQTINTAGSGFNFGSISVNDLLLYNSADQSGLTDGTTVVLSAGTFTTTFNVAGAPPANGSYTTFISGNNGFRCSTGGIAAAPTAASVSVSGRVLTSNRRGLANAYVYLTDSEGNTRTARTNSFGYYRFNDIAAGQSVTITVVSKRYQFAPQVLNLNEEMTRRNFLAEP